MSQDYHHHHHHPGLFSFGFERSQGENLQQIRREKFPPPPVAAAAIQEEEQADGLVGNNNETSGMLSEMFNFNFHHSTPNSTLQGFHGTPNEGGQFSQFTWPGNDGGLSLSLSSSLHHLDTAKPGEEFRIAGGDGSGMMFFGQGVGPAPSSEYPCKNNLNLISGMDPDPAPHIHVGFGSSIGLRNSKYAKAAQELLEDFCSVVRGQTRQFTKNNNNKSGSVNPNSNPTTTSDGGDGGDATNNSPSTSTPPLSGAERIEHQRRKVKLLSMLDEVDRRYNIYCEQMQMVVNSFDLVMGFGAAGPYTVLAQKAMSRHFRCLKEAVAAQLKHSCEMLGEKDGCTLGLTKGETPRLKMLEQSLRQQRAFHHQIGMMEPEAWRPQRGLPEKSVNALRAWLFEHFLHPYPSDADKHMLARQTGLSRSQVSNWFINARVRLWKPMVEEMYQQEVKVDDSTEQNNTIAHSPTPNSPTTTTATTSPPPSATADTVAAIATINAATESDPSLLSINANVTLPDDTDAHHYFPTTLYGGGADTCHRRFGTNAAGNVSLTLGLRHAGNLPDKNNFFGS